MHAGAGKLMAIERRNLDGLALDWRELVRGMAFGSDRGARDVRGRAIYLVSRGR